MKRETSSDEGKKGVGGGLFAGEGSSGAYGSEEGVGSSHLPSAAIIRGVPPSAAARQVPSWSTSRLSNEQSSKVDLARVSSSPIATTSRLWSFGSAEISPTASADVSAFRSQLAGMSRWKGDGRKPAEAPETLGGKADSADSFGSTLSKKSKGDIKLRASLALKTRYKEDLPASSLTKQSMSQNNECAGPMDVQQQRDRDGRKQGYAGGPGDIRFLEKQHIFGAQKSEVGDPVPQEQMFDMHHIRSTILKQEAVFRDQVRELHRVHKVQTRLMADLRRKGSSDLLAHPSGTSLAGPSQSPVAFGLNPGQWKCSMGQVPGTAGHEFEPAVSLSETLRGGSTVKQRDASVSSRPLQAANLFKHSSRVAPVRRTFDLERPPDDDDDEQRDHRKENDGVETDGNCIKFIESPESCANEPDSDMFSLNLGSGCGGGRGKALKDDSEQSSRPEAEVAKILKRPREEAALFPFLATKSESLRDAPLRPTPSVANQSFLGGLWGLQLGRKVEGSSTPGANNRSPEEESGEAPKKKERLSLNLEVEEEVVPSAASNGAPHWLLKAPAAKPPSRKAVCQTDISALSFQDSFSPPRNNNNNTNSDQGVMKSFPQSRGDPNSGSTPIMFWDSQRHVSDDLPRTRSQSTHDATDMSEDNRNAGARGVHQAQLRERTVRPTGGERTAGYGPPKVTAQSIEDSPGESLTLSPWKESSGVPPNGFSSNTFSPGGGFTTSRSHHHPVTGGGFSGQLRTMEGHPSGLAAQGQVGSSAVFRGTGAAPRMWYHQSNSGSEYRPSFEREQYPSVFRQQPEAAVPLARQVSQGGGYIEGSAFAIPAAAAGPPLGFPLSLAVQQKAVVEDLPGPNWTSGKTTGPPFSPFSIVAPPKPPFKRPPKLVLTHDGTGMELKLVSRERREAGAKPVAGEKSFTGCSDEELSVKKEWGASDGAPARIGRAEDVRDGSNQSSEGRLERDTDGGVVGETRSVGPSNWMEKALSSARGSQGGRVGVEEGAEVVIPTAQQEGLDDGDRGSSDAGSGGSGVGDVINPGDRGSPSEGPFVLSGSNKNLPAGEGEEGVNMGELGLQADSESHSGRAERKEATGSKDQEKPASLSVGGSSLSVIPRKISRESSDGPGHVVDEGQKAGRRPAGHSKQLLSGASSNATSTTAAAALVEKDGGLQQLQHKPYSPVMRQISTPSSAVEMERRAEGSAKKVSQASETDQGNGRSPRRTSEWTTAGPAIAATTTTATATAATSVDQQDRLRRSPGGVDSSCEEVDGTLTSCNDSSMTWSEVDEDVQRTW